MSQVSPLFPIPNVQTANVARAAQLYAEGNFAQVITFAQNELARVENAIALNLKKPDGVTDSSSEQYRALTVVAVNAFAAQDKWKDAKEILGRYRVRFPQDAWGFEAGAVVTRRDTQVKDKAAVERAIELLQGEAQRLKSKGKN